MPHFLPRLLCCAALLLLAIISVHAQVGIGTANVAPASLLQLESTTSAFVLPRMADTQMTAIANPPVGSMVFNASDNIPYFNGSAGWTGFDIKSNPSIILSRSNGTFSTSPTVAYAMILTASNIVSNSSAYFSVPTAATVKVNRSGTYLLSVSLSTTNMPAGNRNYYLAAYKNGILIGYLSRSKLQNPSSDYWGTTGTLMYPADAGDEFSFKYYINHNANLTTAFQTICITKLN
ncbi:hypothetical protein [Flavobacterium sp.]|uniref:hypothetical protein n=1 Tax=Flavobacterium sp. TaxID=239 RepID=UPI0039E28282